MIFPPSAGNKKFYDHVLQSRDINPGATAENLPNSPRRNQIRHEVRSRKGRFLTRATVCGTFKKLCYASSSHRIDIAIKKSNEKIHRRIVGEIKIPCEKPYSRIAAGITIPCDKGVTAGYWELSTSNRKRRLDTATKKSREEFRKRKINAEAKMAGENSGNATDSHPGGGLTTFKGNAQEPIVVDEPEVENPTKTNSAYLESDTENVQHILVSPTGTKLEVQGANLEEANKSNQPDLDVPREGLSPGPNDVLPSNNCKTFQVVCLSVDVNGIPQPRTNSFFLPFFPQYRERAR